MLFSRLKKELMKPARPARRRSHARTIELQDLEPRLFLSVNSLVADDGAAEQEETPADVGVESTSIDNAQMDSPIEIALADTGSASGFGSGPVAMANDPYFTSADLGEDEFGFFINGTVDWDDALFLDGIQIDIYDNNTGNLVGHAYTDFTGSFYMGNCGTDDATLKLIHPNTGQVCDLEFVSI